MSKALVIFFFLFSQASFAAAKLADFTFAFSETLLPQGKAEVVVYSYFASTGKFSAQGTYTITGRLKKAVITTHPLSNAPQAWFLTSTGELYFQGDSKPRSLGVVDICEMAPGKVYALLTNRELREIQFDFKERVLLGPLPGNDKLIGIENSDLNKVIFLTEEKAIQYRIGTTHGHSRQLWEIGLKNLISNKSSIFPFSFSPRAIISHRSDHIVVTGYEVQTGIPVLFEIDMSDKLKPIVIEYDLNVRPFNFATRLNMFEINNAPDLLLRVDDDLVTYPIGSQAKSYSIESDFLKPINLLPTGANPFTYSLFFDYPNISKHWLPRQKVLLNSTPPAQAPVPAITAAPTPATPAKPSTPPPAPMPVPPVPAPKVPSPTPKPTVGSVMDPVTAEQFVKNIEGQFNRARLRVPTTAEQWSYAIGRVGAINYFFKDVTDSDLSEIGCKKSGFYNLVATIPNKDVSVEKIAEILAKVQAKKSGCNGPLK